MIGGDFIGLAMKAAGGYKRAEVSEADLFDKLDLFVENSIDKIKDRKMVMPGVEIIGEKHKGYEDWYYTDVTIEVTDKLAAEKSTAKSIKIVVTKDGEEKEETKEIPKEEGRKVTFEITEEGINEIKIIIIDRLDQEEVVELGEGEI